MLPWGLLPRRMSERGCRRMSVNVKVEIRLQMKLHFVAVPCLTLSREIGPQIR